MVSPIKATALFLKKKSFIFPLVIFLLTQYRKEMFTRLDFPIMRRVPC